MHKTITSLCASALLLGGFSGTLDAERILDRFYARVDGGAVLTGDFTAKNSQPDLQINDLGRSWTYGAGLGYFLNRDFRLEVKATRRSSMRYQYFSESIDTIDLTVGKLANTSVTLGLYYQLFHLNRSTPYIGIGGGYSRNTLFDNNRLADLDVGRATPLNNISTNNIGFFISTGTWIDITPNWLIDISGSYVNLGRVGPILSSSAQLDNIAVFELNLGLIFKFQ